MRKNVIYAIHPDSDAVLYLDFYYRSVGDGQYLFSCPYRRCLHLYFADGKSFRELREHRDWLKNRKLTIFVEGRLKKTLRRLYPQERQVPQMPEELMKGFLEQTIECVDAFSDALNYILHHYQRPMFPFIQKLRMETGSSGTCTLIHPGLLILRCIIGNCFAGVDVPATWY